MGETSVSKMAAANTATAATHRRTPSRRARLPFELLETVLQFLHPHSLLLPLSLTSRDVRERIVSHLLPNPTFAHANLALSSADIDTVHLAHFPSASYWRAAIRIHGFTLAVADSILQPVHPVRPARGGGIVSDEGHEDGSVAPTNRQLAYVSHSPDRPPVLTLVSYSSATKIRLREALASLAPVVEDWLHPAQGGLSSPRGGALLFPMQFAAATASAPILASALPLLSCICDNPKASGTDGVAKARHERGECPRARKLAENLLWTIVWSPVRPVEDAIIQGVFEAVAASFGKDEAGTELVLRGGFDGSKECGNRRVMIAVQAALMDMRGFYDVLRH